ncbi:EamA family transporter [archaeon]|nr:EamA family transporter [archaeon]MBL7056755.1 EamA family transporter [Candidatus Woesearchaeota archaeon]
MELDWYVYALLSAIFVGIVGIFNKKILNHEHALEFTASRGIFLGVFSLFLIPFVNFGISWKIYLLIYLISLIACVGLLFFMKSVRHGEVSVVAPLTNISPLFLVIIAFFVLNEIPTSKQYIGIFLLVVGAYSLEVGITNKGFIEPIKGFVKSKIVHHLLIALVIFSMTAVLDKMILDKYASIITYLFVFTIFKSINFIIIESYKHGFSEIKNDLKKDFKLLLPDSILLFFGHVFYLLAVAAPGASISLVIPIKRMSTLFTTIFGGSLFHEKNLLIKVLACIIMIWGAVFILL